MSGASSLQPMRRFAEGFGHADQAELIKLIEGRMGEQYDLLKLVARTTDIGVKDRHAVRGARSATWRSRLLSRMDLTEP